MIEALFEIIITIILVCVSYGISPEKSDPAEKLYDDYVGKKRKKIADKLKSPFENEDDGYS